MLQPIPAKDGPVFALIGRDFFMLGDYKRSAEAMEKAVSAEPANAEFALWLGRAYGRRAESASPFTAPGLALKARQYFEKAVQLDPRYVEAFSDLFEYYLEAPGFLGGGMDKAEATAVRIGQLTGREPRCAGRSGRETQAVWRRRRTSAPSRNSVAEGHRPADRPGRVPVPPGPDPGSRPVHGSRREDCGR